jgi:translocation and assembly module TamA
MRSFDGVKMLSVSAASAARALWHCQGWVFALVFVACQHLPPTPDAQRIEAFTIAGTSAVSRVELESKLATAASSSLPLIGRAEWFDESVWQLDLRRIIRFYEAQGFYQAAIVEQRIEEVGRNAVRLFVRISEGAPTRIRSVTMSGEETLSSEERLQLSAVAALRVGDVFIEERWIAAKAQVLRHLRQSGFADAVVTGTAVVDAPAGEVEIEISAAPGIRYRFGLINVAAMPGSVVPAKLLVSQIAGDLKPGDPFSQTALEDAQRRISQLGVFSLVKVTAGATEPERQTVPVVVDVREAPMRSVRTGFGFGGDLIRQEARVLGEYTNRNVGFSRLFNRDARLDRLTARGKVGWAFLPTIWDVFSGSPTAQDGPFGRLKFEYEVPRFLGFLNTSLETSIDALRTLDLAFDYLGAEYRIGLLWKPRPNFSVFPSLNFNVYGLRSDIPAFSSAPSAALGCPRLPLVCVVSFVDLQLEWDNRDNRLEPTRGWYATLGLQGGFSRAEQLEPYLRVAPELRGYKSFWNERLTMTGKLKAGTLVANTLNTPVVARFFSGGSLMRGFNQRRLSPQVAFAPEMTEDDFVRRFVNQGADANSAETRQQAQAAFQRCGESRRARLDPPECRRFEEGVTLPVGGNGLFEASFEVRIRVLEAFSLAVFADVGLVTESPLGLSTDFGRFVYLAFGIGARYRLPIGPVRLDFGIRVPSIGGAQQVTQLSASPINVGGSNGCFVAGNRQSNYAGAPDNWCAVHLSIGEAY